MPFSPAAGWVDPSATHPGGAGALAGAAQGRARAARDEQQRRQERPAQGEHGEVAMAA